MRALSIVMAADPATHQNAIELLDKAMELAPRDPVPLALGAWCHAQRARNHFVGCQQAERNNALRLASDASTMSAGDPLAATMLSAAYMLAHDLVELCWFFGDSVDQAATFLGSRLFHRNFPPRRSSATDIFLAGADQFFSRRHDQLETIEPRRSCEAPPFSCASCDGETRREGASSIQINVHDASDARQRKSKNADDASAVPSRRRSAALSYFGAFSRRRLFIAASATARCRRARFRARSRCARWAEATSAACRERSGSSAASIVGDGSREGLRPGLPEGHAPSPTAMSGAIDRPHAFRSTAVSFPALAAFPHARLQAPKLLFALRGRANRCANASACGSIRTCGSTPSAQHQRPSRTDRSLACHADSRHPSRSSAAPITEGEDWRVLAEQGRQDVLKSPVETRADAEPAENVEALRPPRPFSAGSTSMADGSSALVAPRSRAFGFAPRPARSPSGSGVRDHVRAGQCTGARPAVRDRHAWRGTRELPASTACWTSFRAHRAEFRSRSFNFIWWRRGTTLFSFMA